MSSIAIDFTVIGSVMVFFAMMLLVTGLTASVFATPAAIPRMTGSSRPAASPTSGQVVCLRLTWQLSADTADALVDAVTARVRTAAPPASAVVLDLSATPAVDGGSRAALQSLHGLLAQDHVGLRLALSGTRACAQFLSDSAGSAIGPEVVHASARTAMLAEYATLPGPALVTSAMRGLLSQQPEPLLLPAISSRPAAMDRTPGTLESASEQAGFAGAPSKLVVATSPA